MWPTSDCQNSVVKYRKPEILILQYVPFLSFVLSLSSLLSGLSHRDYSSILLFFPPRHNNKGMCVVLPLLTSFVSTNRQQLLGSQWQKLRKLPVPPGCRLCPPFDRWDVWSCLFFLSFALSLSPFLSLTSLSFHLFSQLTLKEVVCVLSIPKPIWTFSCGVFYLFIFLVWIEQITYLQKVRPCPHRNAVMC